MKVLNVLIFLLIFNTFILLGFLVSEMTGKVIYGRVSVNLTRVIDGDTVVVSGGGIGNDVHIRMLGINTPEKNQPFHDEAENFLEKYEGKMVELESHGKDKYSRILGYIYFNGKLINAEILREGLANLYVYDKDEHYSELVNAEQDARDEERGIWKKSANYGCIKTEKFEPIDKNGENETLILRNICSIKLSIIIKDDANHIYNEKIQANSILEKYLQNIFNDDGDTLLVRDDSGLLLFYRY